MISCTLESLPTLRARDVLSERCESLTPSPFQASKSAAGACRRNASTASFAICPSGSYTRTTPLAIERPQRTSCTASRERLWGDHRVLLSTGKIQLKDGIRVNCRNGSQLLELERRGLVFLGIGFNKGPRDYWNWSKRIRSSRSDAGNENEYCDRPHDQPHGACSFRRSSSPSTREGANYVEVSEGSDPDQSGYTIKVSKELMGVFRYVEKVKRARIKDLADTLRQTAAACMFFSCVRGIVSPLVEVFQTRPPSWGRLILMLSAFDSFAITYLAFKASEPLEKLSMLASESEKDIMGSIEKEEEHMLALAVELVKLFRRMRNITVCTAIAQFATLMHSLLRLNNPKLVASATKAFAIWLNSPWN